jgi:hypothetical protein
LDNKKFKKNTAEKIIFFLSKISIYLSLGIRTSKLEENPSAPKKEHPALQKMKFVGHFCPDPDYEFGSGSRDPIEFASTSDTDTNPQNWFQVQIH